MSNVRPYLDYYGDHGVIPVRQDTSDLRRHMSRRSGLYRQLGIVPALIEGKRVIEFGPGSGDNAIHTAALRPAKYVLVDGNPASLETIKQKVQTNVLDGRRIELVQSDIIHYRDDERYDLVLAEGVIPNQRNPEEFCRRIGEFAKPGGIVVVSTMAEISLFPELCRRVLRVFFPTQARAFQEVVNELVNFFKQDLDSLVHMSRRYDDWVIDQILVPWGPDVCFSVPRAIEAMSGAFDVYQASPGFIDDWRWYKSIDLPDKEKNRQAVEQYYDDYIYFIDYRLQRTDVLNKDLDSRRLESTCKSALELERVINERNDQSRLPEFLDICEAVILQITPAVPGVAACLADYISGVRQMRSGVKTPDFGAFRGLFGRGQQYLSFIRNES